MDELEQAAAAMAANAQAVTAAGEAPAESPVDVPALPSGEQSAPLRSSVGGAAKSTIKRQPKKTAQELEDETEAAMLAAFGPSALGDGFGFEENEEDEDAPVPLIVGITKRNWLFQGFYLDPRGALYGEAIRFADIAIPLDREDIAKQKRVLLTQSNSSVETKDHSNAPPSLDMCVKVVAEMNRRRPRYLKQRTAELEESESELADHNLPKDERSYMRDRVKALKRYIAVLERQAEITPAMLREWFAREDLALRGAAVPPEMRAAFDVIEREREAVNAFGPGLGGSLEFAGMLN